MHLDDERVVSRLQNIALSDSVFQMLVPVKESFLQNFHGEVLLLIFQAAPEYFTESSVAQNFLDVERFESYSFCSIVQEDRL